jgi:hypothetical protein
MRGRIYGVMQRTVSVNVEALGLALYMPPVQPFPSDVGPLPITLIWKLLSFVVHPPPMAFFPAGQGRVPTISTPAGIPVDASTF